MLQTMVLSKTYYNKCILLFILMVSHTDPYLLKWVRNGFLQILMFLFCFAIVQRLT